MENEKTINYSRKPINVIENENEVLKKCRMLEKEFPQYLKPVFNKYSNSLLPKSQLSYYREIRLFLNYLIDCTDITASPTIKGITKEELGKVTAIDIDAYIKDSASYTVLDKDDNERTYSNGDKGKHHKRAVMVSFFNKLYDTNIVSNNITGAIGAVRVQKQDERTIKCLTNEEARRMLEAVETGKGLTEKQLKSWENTKLRDRAILILFLTYGLRISELQQLNVSSFNFDRKEFIIYRKENKESSMPLNNTATKAVCDYIELERSKDKDEDALFLSIYGERLKERQIRELVKKYTNIGTQGKPYSPHKLRATTATSLIEQGASIYDVQALMDHKNVTTTQIYAKHKENTKKMLISNFEWDE